MSPNTSRFIGPLKGQERGQQAVPWETRLSKKLVFVTAALVSPVIPIALPCTVFRNHRLIATTCGLSLSLCFKALTGINNGTALCSDHTSETTLSFSLLFKDSFDPWVRWKP